MSRRPNLRAPQRAASPTSSSPTSSSSTPGSSSSRESRDGRPDWVGDLLRDLPREQASQQFTSNVLRAARLRSSEPRRSSTPAAMWSRAAYGGVALAAAVLLGFLLAPFLGFDAGSSRVAAPLAQERGTRAPVTPSIPVSTDGTSRDVDSIRSELRSLRRELTELRQLRADVRPVAAIEGDDYDVVIDLRDFLSAVESSGGAAGQGNPRSSRVVPTMW